jgi:hypothetical protein
MIFNYGFQNMSWDIIAKGNRYVLEKVTNLKHGSCILTCIASGRVIFSYTSYEKGLKDMAKREHEDILLDIQRYLY